MGGLIPPQHIKYSYVSVNVYNTNEVKRGTIRGNNVNHEVDEDILVDIVTIT